MKNIKKLLAIILFAAITLTAMSVTSFADLYDEAVAIDSGETVNGKSGKGVSLTYEIIAKTSGTLTVQWTTAMSYSNLYVYDEDGAYLPVETLNIKAGSLNKGGEGQDYINGEWNEASQRFSATATYKVNKGIYYILIKGTTSIWYDGDGSVKLTATYPTESKEVKISYLGLTMKKGDTLQLSAILSGGKDTVTWTSSKKTVASVTSSGKVTAKKKGSTIITAKCGDSVMKIKIKVT